MKNAISISVLCLLVSMTGELRAQQVFGSIYGTISDPTGAPVPNSKVTITDQQKGTRSEVLSNESGNYQKGQLIPGIYTVEVETPSFKRAISKDVPVNIDQASRIDVALQIGDVAQQIEVSATAPLLQADRAEVATNFTANQLENLPTLDRNFRTYELLVPGAQRFSWNQNSAEDPQGSTLITVNGQLFSGTGYQLDGTDNQDPILGIIVINPALDAIAESRITSQNYDAEFGVATAGLVNVSTKSGSNDFHGSAFEYLRNNSPGFQDFARNPFNPAENNQVPTVQWNQFGGSIGGRVIRNKLFFFGDAQLTRRRTGGSVKTSVPTADARNGDLSGYLNDGNNQIYDPMTGDPTTGIGRLPFPNNVIPTSRLSPQALAVLKLIPLPNAGGDPGKAYSNNFATTGSGILDTNQWDTRGDYVINEKSSLFGRYSQVQVTNSSPGAFGDVAGGPPLDVIGFAGGSNVTNRSLALGYNYTITPTLLTEFRFGWVNYNVQTHQGGLGTTPATTAGIPGLNLDPTYTSGLPYFDLQGDAEEKFGYALNVNSCNCPLTEQERQFQYVNNTSKIAGNHTFKTGIDLRFATNLRVPSDSHRAGELYFAPGETGTVPGVGAGVQKGLGLATFLLGDVSSFDRYVSSSTDAREYQRRFFWYGQDKWRVNNKLTLDYGVRWEMIFPETVNKPGNGGQLDLRTGLINVFGVGKVSDHGIQDMNWANWAPRVGISYQIAPKTVLRAAYGWSYSLGTFGSIFGHNVTQNLPVLAIQQFNPANGFSGVFGLGQGPTQPTFPAPDANGYIQLPDGVRAKARPLDVRLPRVEAYNVTLQQQFGKDWSLQLGWVANDGRHVFMGDGPSFDVNTPAYVQGVSNTNLNKPFYQKYGWTQGIDFYCDCANNSYESMQVQLVKRYGYGLTLQAGYTLQYAEATNGDSYAFLYDRPLGYGNEEAVSRNTFTLATNYEIPFGRGRRYGGNLNRALDLAAGGWSVNGITVLYSGIPFTPSIGTEPAGVITPNVGPNNRPDQGTQSPYSGAQQSRSQWFVGGLGSAFLAPASYTFGNYPVNGLFGPKFVNQDLSLSKNFVVTERFKMNLRAEAFNVFNHTSLGLPNSNVTDPNAGQITGLANGSQMRRFQFGMRLDF